MTTNLKCPSILEKNAKISLKKYVKSTKRGVPTIEQLQRLIKVQYPSLYPNVGEMYDFMMGLIELAANQK